MSIFKTIRHTFLHFNDFKGKSGRKEFWYFYIFRLLCIYSFMVPGAYLLLRQIGRELRSGIYTESLSRSEPLGTLLLSLGIFIMMVFFVPFLSLRIRRLRTIGWNPNLILLWIIPFIGPLIILIGSAKKDK